MLRQLRNGFVAGLLALTASSCDRPDANPWRALLQAERDRVVDIARWEQALECRVVEDPTTLGIQLEWTLEPAGWESLGRGMFHRPLPSIPRLSDTQTARRELKTEAHSFTFQPPGPSALRQGLGPQSLAGLKRGTFGASGNHLYLRLEDDEEPTLMVLREHMSRGGRLGPLWTPQVGPAIGLGIPVLPTEVWSVRSDVPAKSALRFFHAARGVPSEGATHVRFEISLQGEVIWSHERALGETHDRWETVPLPGAAIEDARFSFRVDGPPALTAFMNPRLGPAKPTSAAESPRSDVVLFLADTFRADNLSAYGGDPEWTPFLNKLAKESVLFESAWAASTWTLPSHATLFSGLQPPQHGAQRQRYALPRSATTLAEAFAKSGYRTGAITDSNFVSYRFGMHQGFEWFFERAGHERDLSVTLQRAHEFLTASDGRPTLLFVQTYRVHVPYRVGPDESPQPVQDFIAKLEQEAAAKGVEVDEEELFAGLFDFYRQASSDLDSKTAEWWQELGRTDDLPERYFIFTSDHGEAFLEHGEKGHRGHLWEEVLRIPLFIHGPGMTPRAASQQASLLDLPRTLTSLCGVAPSPTWGGIDLFGHDGRSEVLGFHRYAEEDQVALIDGGRKAVGVFFSEPLAFDRMRCAFDLNDDPQEKVDVTKSAAWSERLQHRMTELMESYQRNALAPELLGQGALDEATLRDMEALGYLGEE